MAKKEYDPAIAARVPKEHKEVLDGQKEFYKIRMSELIRKIVKDYCKPYLKN